MPEEKITLEKLEAGFKKNRETFYERMEEEKKRERRTYAKGVTYLINT